MTFLQIQKTADNQAKILELGTDLSYMSDEGSGLILYDKYYWDEIITDSIVPLSDCYQSRPLIEVDGFCEFDIVNIYLDNNRINEKGEWVATNENFLVYFDGQAITFKGWDNERYDERELFRFTESSYILTNLGSIFDPETSKKYPNLYQQALEIIKK